MDGAKDKREGADKDADRMRTMFDELGFEIIFGQNMTASEIEKEIQKAASKPCDCFVFVVSTHGEEIPLSKESVTLGEYDQTILGTDGNPVSINKLLDMLNNETLKGIPKLCFLQACRSIKNDPEDVKYDSGVDVVISNPKTK
ncbi:hypothetical protein DPMN_109786 [Dreissena polymorpha]|uniref:Caspase family p20 domain-containing protein n=1 Tax=Dreissena polymorpha TaxID=45954 RepID=A0A9D4QMB4_DREPO|nr:hypothetical protein DPMN_109786 [Dreissena polymorpha]